MHATAYNQIPPVNNRLDGSGTHSNYLILDYPHEHLKDRMPGY
jgi:hypothetical protein